MAPKKIYLSKLLMAGAEILDKPVSDNDVEYIRADIIRDRCVFRMGYEQAEKDIIAIIESRISEIIGDAQPKPALRAELEELITRIKNEN